MVDLLDAHAAVVAVPRREGALDLTLAAFHRRLARHAVDNLRLGPAADVATATATAAVGRR